MDPRTLDPKDFTPCDLARIELAYRTMSISNKCAEIVHMLCDDTAVSGDYIAKARTLETGVSMGLIAMAVVAERVRGSSWQTIGQALGISADDAEHKWASAEERWQRTRTPAQSCYAKNPGGYTAAADRYVTTGATYRSGHTTSPLTMALDAASAHTGRDSMAADRAFSPDCCPCAKR